MHSSLSKQLWTRASEMKMGEGCQVRAEGAEEQERYGSKEWLRAVAGQSFLHGGASDSLGTTEPSCKLY